MTRDRPQGFLIRMRGDRSGASAVEFALIAPLMIGFYLGLAEFCQGFMAQKRLGSSTAAIADLVSQASTVKVSDLNDIFYVGDLTMRPFAATTLKQRVTSVTRDDKGVVKVDWSLGDGMSARASGSVMTSVPTGLIDNNESLVISEASYDYDSPFDYLLPAVTQFSAIYYLRPRQVEKTECTDCPPT